jgi:hypothetical protein
MEFVVLLVCMAVAYRFLRPKIRRMRAKAKVRKLLSQGYLPIEVMVLRDLCNILAFDFRLTETQYVHESVVAPFRAARTSGLTEYNRIADEQWNRFVSDRITGSQYVAAMNLAAAAYHRLGDQLARDTAALGVSPQMVQSIRRTFYDYAFESPDDVLLLKPRLATSLAHPVSPNRPERTTRRPMRDVTPGPERLGRWPSIH